MYNSIYQLIANAIFESASLTGYQDLVVTLLSTFAIVFVFSLPFVVVLKVIKIILGD